MPERTPFPLRVASLAVIPLACLACDAEKSRNPLSPTVAGPIAGVTISAPKPLEPVNGAKVQVTRQPVRLLFENALSNSERPFWHVVEVAADSGFTRKVHTSGKVSPGPNGRATHQLPTLAGGRSYYWRVKAEDGANSGPFSEAKTFEVLMPVVIETPVPVAPVNNQVASSNPVDFVMNNGGVSGPAAPVDYRVEVAMDQGFGHVIAVGNVRRSGSSRTTARLALPPGAQLYWRARGSDGGVTSPWSAVQVFRTAAPEPPPPPPGGGGGPSPVPPPPPGRNRTPDPPPGQKLPLPDMSWAVREVAQQYPSALRSSCQHHGGTWEFMDRVLNRLREYDTRWGYNWKRGVMGDASLDVVDYHWGPGADEGSTDVYIIDVITGHCGSNPQPGWGDVTQVTLNAGTIGRWTGRGRF